MSSSNALPSQPPSAGVAAKKRALLLDALGGGSRPADSQSAGGQVPWPESLYDRVMRTRVEVAEVFENAASEDIKSSHPSDQHSTAGTANSASLRLVEADILRCIQRLADALPRTLYQESIAASMRHEYDGQQKALTAQQQQVTQQQQQLYNAKRLHQHAAAALSGSDAAPSLGDGLASPTAASVLSSPSRSGVQSRTGGRARPASAGPTSGAFVGEHETFAAAQVRHLYTQLHDTRFQLQHETQRVEALKAFCIRKDAAVDYIRETLLQEVVTLKEQLRRQEHDPNFISEFVTLFDCWKVLQGDDPSGGTAGNSAEAVRHAKKELQAEAARVQHQFQLSLRKKEDEVAELQRQLQSAQKDANSLEKKKSQKGKKDNDFNEQFMQLTTDMAKKDVCIADMTEEIKQLQTEVAIAQQLARSTRDQLNRSELDVEEAVAVRDAEILAKVELIQLLESENAQLRSNLTDDALTATKVDLSHATDAVTVMTKKLESVEGEREQLMLENRKLLKVIESRETELSRLSDLSQMDSDEKAKVLLQQIETLQKAVASEHALVETAQLKAQTLETELDKVSSNYETAKFEHTKLRSALRRGGGGLEGSANNQTAIQQDGPNQIMDDIMEAVPPLEVLDGGQVVKHDDGAAATGDPAASQLATMEALERRLSKEVALRKRFKAESDAAQEELSAVKDELRALLMERETAERTLSASNSVRSPRKVDGGSKSPRRRSGSVSKKPMPSDTTDRSGDTDAQQALQEKSEIIAELEREVERLRNQISNDAANALLQRPAATFTYHVAPDEGQRPPSIPTSDIPNILIEAAKDSSAPSTRARKDAEMATAKADATSRRKFQHSDGDAPPTNKIEQRKPLSRPSGTSNKMPPPPTKGKGGDGPTPHQPDYEVSPFTATLANFQDMDVMEVGHGEWRDASAPGATDIEVSFAEGRGETSPPPLSDADEVYHRALHGGGSGHHTTSQSGMVSPFETSEPRIAVLEASIMDKDQELRRVLLQSATLEGQLTKLMQRVADQDGQIRHLHKAANAPLSLPSFIPAVQQSAHAIIATASRGVSPMTAVFDQPLGTFASQLADAPSAVPSPSEQIVGAIRSPVVADPSSRMASPICPIVVSIAAACQTELTMVGMNALLELSALGAAAGAGASRSDGRGPPPLSGNPSRQGSAAHQRPTRSADPTNRHHVVSNELAEGTASDDDDGSPPLPGGAVQRIFSAHRRAVHTAGSSVSVAQKSSRVTTETQFYLTTDGVQGSGVGGDHDGDDDVYADWQRSTNHSLPSGRVLRPRPQGSAGNRGGSVGEKITSAVAVAKGLSDRNKSSMTRVRAASEENIHSGGGLEELMARPSSSLSRKQPSPSILQQVHRPLAPAVLSGTSTEGIQSIAKAQLSQHTWRIAPATAAPGTLMSPLGPASLAIRAVSPEDGCGALIVTTKPPPESERASNSVAGHPPLPTTVDYREHVAQVVHGGGHEDGAIRGVKGKIKQNINVDKFMSKVLTVRH